MPAFFAAIKPLRPDSSGPSLDGFETSWTLFTRESISEWMDRRINELRQPWISGEFFLHTSSYPSVSAELPSAA